MSAITLLFAVFFLLCAGGIIAALLVPEEWNPPVLAVIGSLEALIILVASALLLAGSSFRVELWPVLSLGTMILSADRLSALFLFVAGLVFLPVSIFSGVYLVKYRGHYNLAYFGVLYHVLLASIVLVFLAGDAISFLTGWEIMTIASYLLVNFEYEREESSRAGNRHAGDERGWDHRGCDCVPASWRYRGVAGIRAITGSQGAFNRRGGLGCLPFVVLRLCGQSRPFAG